MQVHFAEQNFFLIMRSFGEHAAEGVAEKRASPEFEAFAGGPIKKTGDALARYLAGYLSKSFEMVPAGKKSRLVRLSRGLSRDFSMQFSIWSLGNLIYRTRLKMAAEMLHFQEYGDFADYFGPRWNYYIGDIIAAVPVPMKFAKGDFERGVAAKILGDYAENEVQ